MAMVYDLPTADPSVESTPPVAAPAAQNAAAAQAQETGAAMSRTGATVTQITDDLRDHIDDAVTKEADNKLADFHRSLLYDPDNGFLEKAGKSALESRPDVIKAAQDKQKEIEGGLSNDVQRYMFHRVSEARTNALLTQVDGHAAQQAQVYHGAETKAAMDGAMLDAVHNAYGYDIPGGAYDKAKALMLSNADSVARIAGFRPGDDAYKQLTLAATTKLHTDAIGLMIDEKHPDIAKEYLKAHVDEISPDQQGALSLKVRANTIAQDGINTANDVWNTVMKDVPRNNAVPQYTIEQEIHNRFKDDPDREQAAISKARELRTAWDSQRNELNAQDINTIHDMLSGGASLASVKASDPWRNIPGHERSAIEDHQEALLTTQANRAAAVSARQLTDLQRGESLRFLQNAGTYFDYTNPDKLRSVSRDEVKALWSKLDDSHVAQLLVKWDAVHDPTKYDEAKMDSEDFNQVATSLGFKPGSNDVEDKNRLGALRSSVDGVITSEQLNLKRSLTRQEKRDLIRKETSRQVLTNPGWFSSNVKAPVMAITPDKLGTVVVPADHKAKIKAALDTMYKETGNERYKPTDENVAREYLRKNFPNDTSAF